MAKILSSKAFIDSKKSELTLRCNKLKSSKVYPCLHVVIVGQNPASLSYVKNKRLLCNEVGADCQIISLQENIDLQSFVAVIQRINDDKNVHGIIIQLPLPSQLQTLNISELICHKKDVDGFHPKNTMSIYYNQNFNLLPCTPAGIMNFLQEYLKLDLSKKLVCVIGRSNIVGKPMVHLLNSANATVIWCHSKTQNLKALTKQSDIIISATGARHFLGADFFDQNKEQLVIDVGISGGQGMSLAGDLDSNSIKDFAKLSYTPVPGGVGPLTVYKLVENLISTCEKNFSNL